MGNSRVGRRGCGEVELGGGEVAVGLAAGGEFFVVALVVVVAVVDDGGVWRGWVMLMLAGSRGD